ncbi:MAG: hypothetical protein ACHQUC_04245 [Chlamydiales bacterium]
MTAKWDVDLSRDAKKQYKALMRNGVRPSITDAIDTLVIDLQTRGVALVDWPNYGVIDESKKRSYYHCHLKKGKPTFVVCWEGIENGKTKKIEVFYVGSHENAPYQK